MDFLELTASEGRSKSLEYTRTRDLAGGIIGSSELDAPMRHWSFSVMYVLPCVAGSAIGTAW